ncbi:MAG: hypothetical protein H7X71_05085 [Chitinophagales bacterium]|nr:hypothetical protein [Chitinophagales bacterium]
MKKGIFLFTIIFVLILLSAVDAEAQCAMCKMAAEAGVKAGNTQTAGLNNAILYLAMFPYIVIGSVAFLFWRAYKKRKAEEAELSE